MEKLICISYPAYYKKFACLGGKCPVSCCYGWRIDWRKDEVEKLKNVECSPTLSQIIDTAFESINEDVMVIKCDKISRRCPFLTEDNMCSIQRELGAEYLSNTCMTYPRQTLFCGNIMIQACSISCCHVLEMICDDPSSMKLEYHSLKSGKVTVRGKFDSEIDKLNHPQIKYRRDIFEFYYEILSDETRSIETSIVLCALAAKKMDEFIERKQHERIPEIIKALKTSLINTEQIEKLENAKPNLSLKMNFSAALLNSMNGSDIYKFVFDGSGIPDIAVCTRGIEKFNELIMDKPWVLRNIALNIFLTQRMPYRDIKLNLFDNMCYFASEISAVKFLATVSAARVEPNNIFEVFQLSVAKIDRLFTHNDSKITIVKKVLDTFGIKSPAYLMGILK